jgi:DNA adenine methylase
MKPLVRRYGAKWYLAKQIVQKFPEHTLYVEPFCGSAACFFLKEPSQAEILNDKDHALMSVFETARTRPFELAAALWAMPYAQRNWRAAAKDAIEKSALYIAKSQQFYCGDLNTSTFSVDPGHDNKNKAHVWRDWFIRVFPVADRLKNAQLVSRDAVEIIREFGQRPDALIYCDPPYIGHESEYAESVDYAAFVEAAKNAKAAVIVSEYETATDVWTKAGFRVESMDYTSRAASGTHGKSKRVKEMLFIKNASASVPKKDGTQS